MSWNQLLIAFLSLIFAATAPVFALAATFPSETPRALLDRDVRRMELIREAFGPERISRTCARVRKGWDLFYDCFWPSYLEVVRAQEPTVAGYAILLATGLEVLERQARAVEERVRAGLMPRFHLPLQHLESAALIVQTAERVLGKKSFLPSERKRAKAVARALRVAARELTRKYEKSRDRVPASNETLRRRVDLLLTRLKKLPR